MTRTLSACLTLGALCLLSSHAARASFGDVTLYETIDALKVIDTRVVVTGILVGQSAPSTTTYILVLSGTNASNTVDMSARCDRLALLAMSKPGKFQFGMVDESSGRFSCKLIVRTP
jgi:hypothetical protein